ncbi:MAG: TraR/DksA C4-type zinc finger protein [Anaerolineaceae bacterium]|nr:MAG: TraR/DksA C4-type zinc finger protein [Anaerolineaceae bacterium]
MTESLNTKMIQQMLEEEREKLRQQLQISSGDGRAEAKNPDHMDIAQAYSDQERFHAVQTLEQEHLDQVEAALQAIVEGSYGRCQHCHQPIPLERLQVLPYATMCVSCQA